MKLTKYLAAIAAIFVMASSALAQTTVYIAGAPALRTELTTAIENLLAGQGSVTRAFNGSALITANVIRWKNATIGGQTNVTIKLTYNGSAGGWLANAGGKTVRFIPDSAADGSGATDVLSNTTATADAQIPDFHISNEFQVSTPWRGRNAVSFPENGATTYSTLTDTIVGILPLRLVASKNAPSDLNLTPQLAQQLYVNGELRLSQLTGRTNDYNTKVYPLSRGIDSGVRTLWASANGLGSTPILSWEANLDPATTTNKSVLGITVVSPGTGYTNAPTITIAAPQIGTNRATATATVANGRITGFSIVNAGAGYNSTPSVSIAGGGGANASARSVIDGGTVTNQVLWPAASATGGTNGSDNRVLGINNPEGNGGYVTFGPLLTALTSTLQLPGGSTNDIYLTVLGDSDADSAIRGGAKEVGWNGVKLGTLGTYGNAGTVTAASAPNPTNVGSATLPLAYGQYDLWGYVRLPFLSTRVPSGSAKRQIHTAIANQLKNADSPVLLKDVNVQRYNDGGTVVDGRRL